MSLIKVFLLGLGSLCLLLLRTKELEESLSTAQEAGTRHSDSSLEGTKGVPRRGGRK